MICDEPLRQPRWTTAIFDLDGTLVNTVELIVESFRHAEREVRAGDVDPDIARSWMGRSLVDIYGDAPDAGTMIEAYLRFNHANLEVLQTSYEGVVELLQELSRAGVKVGVATSKGRESARRSVASAGLDDLVELTTTADETVLHKPHPDPILHAQRMLDAGDEQCVYIGDAIWDIRAGRAAGIDQIGVTWGAGDTADLEAETPSAGVAHSVDELRDLLLA